MEWHHELLRRHAQPVASALRSPGITIAAALACLDAAHNADLGLVQRVSRTVAVDAHVGFGLDDEADDFFAGAGISFLF
jgi:hypothetical protein